MQTEKNEEIDARDLIPELVSPSRIIREVPAQVYFSVRLKPQDKKYLKYFVKFLGEGLSEKRVPSVILAVGSSTFPLQYWEKRAIHNINNPQHTKPLDYQDIDLRVLPIEKVSLREMKKDLISVLNTRKYDWKEKEENSLYGLEAISVNLRNGTRVDIITGYPQMQKYLNIAKDEIEKERENNRSFSLIYDPKVRFRIETSRL